jgi:hypothetical protein
LCETPFWSIETAGKAVDVVDVRLVELPGTGGRRPERLHISPLASAKIVSNAETISPSRRCPRSRPGDREDLDVDILEIVSLGAPTTTIFS